MPGAVLTADLVLVPGAGADVRYEQLPYARAAERAHRMGAAIPVVEVADHAHAARARRPHRERGAAEVGPHPGAEHLPQLLVPALADQVQVHLAQRRQMPVRVVREQLRAVVGVADARAGNRRPSPSAVPSPRTRPRAHAASGTWCRRAARPPRTWPAAGARAQPCPPAPRERQARNAGRGAAPQGSGRSARG